MFWLDGNLLSLRRLVYSVSGSLRSLFSGRDTWVDDVDGCQGAVVLIESSELGRFGFLTGISNVHVSVNRP